LLKSSWRPVLAAILFWMVPMSAAQSNDSERTEIAKGISLALLPDLQNVAGLVGDSGVRMFRAEGVECVSDFGAAADPLTDHEGVLTDIQIAGHAARLLSSDTGIDAIHIKNLGTSAIGRANLTVFCRATDPDRRADIRKMLLSIQIR
jgi:hypothetical protein